MAHISMRQFFGTARNSDCRMRIFTNVRSLLGGCLSLSWVLKVNLAWSTLQIELCRRIKLPLGYVKTIDFCTSRRKSATWVLKAISK